MTLTRTDVARAVAQELGDPWSFRPSDDSRPPRIAHPDGRYIYFRLPSQVHGHIPSRAWRQYRFQGRDSEHSIGVTLTRPTKAIAREIRRRLLPHYTAFFREVVTVLAEDDADRDRQEDLQGCLDAANPDTAQYTAKANYGGESATLRTTGLPAEVVFEILDLLRRHLDQQKITAAA